MLCCALMRRAGCCFHMLRLLSSLVLLAMALVSQQAREIQGEGCSNRLHCLTEASTHTSMCCLFFCAQGLLVLSVGVHAGAVVVSAGPWRRW